MKCCCIFCCYTPAVIVAVIVFGDRFGPANGVGLGVVIMGVALFNWWVAFCLRPLLGISASQARYSIQYLKMLFQCCKSRVATSNGFHQCAFYCLLLPHKGTSIGVLWMERCQLLGGCGSPAGMQRRQAVRWSLSHSWWPA
jgi:hypothetical protein